MLSLKEMEFQFWAQFPQFDDEDDANFDNETSWGTRGTKYLPHRDMPLHGLRQDLDVFSVVTCHSCGMILKTQAFRDHFKKRHSNDSLLNEINFPLDVSMEENIEEVIVQTAKRMKIDNSNSSSYMANESFPVQSSSSMLLSQTQSFFSNAQLTAQSTMKPPPKKLEGLKIKMKLKKTDHGMWSIVSA